ncbi:MAG: Unknown protein [uncultured Aureispira sp.]|uniref:Lipocalin-like domain-containing protein n=1 Tax=uncultured Aureispira sp. TaxID=1331704 RepID=A0A6S6SMX8_9BACT|nr:MAG: Unknown protein [uncultured Aureispira sp.]
MKSIFKLLTVVLITVLLASCGGSGASNNIVGAWHVDLSSIDLVLGDGVPAPMKGMVQAQKDGLIAEGEGKSDDVTIEFTEAGKMVVSKKGDEKTEELDYKFDGSKLTLSGDLDGEKVDIDLNISESTAEKLTIAMTGEEILAQIKAKYPEVLAMAGEMDVDTMVKGCTIAISFKK